MTDVKIIIPVHEDSEDVKALLKCAIESVGKNVENCSETVSLTTAIVCPKDIEEAMKCYGVEVIVNDSGDNDFCSQVNFAASHIDTEYFSILEFDDEYSPRWFRAFERYRKSHSDVSLFLPVVTQHVADSNEWSFANEIPLSSSFSNEIGYIDSDALENFFGFNITGGVFNRADFIGVGGLKKSIKVAFAYEFLLRLAKKEMGIFVVPKEGYLHLIGRKTSLLNIYMESVPSNEVKLWYELAKKECRHEKDRNKDISSVAGDKLK